MQSPGKIVIHSAVWSRGNAFIYFQCSRSADQNR